MDGFLILIWQVLPALPSYSCPPSCCDAGQRLTEINRWVTILLSCMQVWVVEVTSPPQVWHSLWVISHLLENINLRDHYSLGLKTVNNKYDNQNKYWVHNILSLTIQYKRKADNLKLTFITMHCIISRIVRCNKHLKQYQCYLVWWSQVPCAQRDLWITLIHMNTFITM